MKTVVWTKPHESRRAFIGGSDARVIMGTDEAAPTRLWREKRGEAEPQDHSGNLIVQLGLATEPLNRSWYERTTGQVIKEIQSWVRHPVIHWMAAKLDGVVEGSGAVFEAKFMLPWSKRLRQPLHDVAALVDLAALDCRMTPKAAPDRPRQRLRTVDDEQARHHRIEPALNQVVDERPARRQLAPIFACLSQTLRPETMEPCNNDVTIVPAT
jgi:YqaJ-like viral recombinase domain